MIEMVRRYLQPRTVMAEAFVVEPSLVGRPLASPTRRGVALLLDLLLAAIMAEMGGLFVGSVIALLFFAMAVRSATDARWRRFGRMTTATMGACALFVTTLVVIGGSDDEDEPAVAKHAMMSVMADDDKASAAQVQQVLKENGVAAEEVAGVVDNPWMPAEARSVLKTLVTSSVDTLSADERQHRAAVLHRYAAALETGDSLSLEPLHKEAEDIVAGAHLNRLTQANAELNGRIGVLEDEKERLEELVDNPGVIRILKALADDIGLTFGWMALYFAFFTTLFNGFTPAKRLFGIRVCRLNGRPLSFMDSLDRMGGYVAGVATGLLGFAQIYWDDNRQAIQDKIAETVVIRV